MWLHCRWCGPSVPFRVLEDVAASASATLLHRALKVTATDVAKCARAWVKTPMSALYRALCRKWPLRRVSSARIAHPFRATLRRHLAGSKYPATLRTGSYVAAVVAGGAHPPPHAFTRCSCLARSAVSKGAVCQHRQASASGLTVCPPCVQRTSTPRTPRTWAFPSTDMRVHVQCHEIQEGNDLLASRYRALDPRQSRGEDERPASRGSMQVAKATMTWKPAVVL